MVDWAKVGRYAGYAFLISVILVSVAAIIGVALLQNTPCYKGALKSTGSHMLALRMASACNNDGKPWPLSKPEFLPLTPITENNKDGTPAVTERPKTIAGILWGVFTATAAMLIVFGVAAYFRATRGKKGEDVEELIDMAGQTQGLAEDMKQRDGSPPTPEDQQADTAESGVDGALGDAADPLGVSNGKIAEARKEVVRLNQQLVQQDGLGPGQVLSADATSPRAQQARFDASNGAEAVKTSLKNAGEASQGAKAATLAELKGETAKVGYVESFWNGLKSVGSALANTGEAMGDTARVWDDDTPREEAARSPLFPEE